MNADLNGKTFRIVLNEGPDPAVNEQTIFRFRQDGDIAQADYSGGGVRAGALLGVVDGATMAHRYIQVNLRGELQAGSSTVAIERTDSGTLRLIDRWTWADGRGSGRCIFEEI
jgi:hypothetical protein